MITEYKGNPIIQLDLGNGKTFAFGKAKAKAILENLEEIRAFVEDAHELSAPQKATSEILDMLSSIEHEVDEHGTWGFNQRSTSKFLRQLLKMNFPDAKFSVKSRTYSTDIELVSGSVAYESVNKLLVVFPDGQMSDGYDSRNKYSKPIMIEGQSVQLNYGYGWSVYPSLQNGGGELTGEHRPMSWYRADNSIDIEWAFACEDCGCGLPSGKTICTPCNRKRNAIKEPTSEPVMNEGQRVKMKDGFLILGGETGVISYVKWDEEGHAWRYHMTFDKSSISSRTVSPDMVDLLEG